MFSSSNFIWIVAGLGGFSCLALSYSILLTPILQNKRLEKRMKRIVSLEIIKKKQGVDGSLRKKRQSDLSKDIERKTLIEFLHKLIARYGLSEEYIRSLLNQLKYPISIERFYLICFAFGFFCALCFLFMGVAFYWFPIILIVTGVWVPLHVLSYLFKKKIRKFLDEFPNAIDIIIRAVKSGLPFNDGLKLISTESTEPVRSEFLRIIEGQKFGLSLPEAIIRMRETVPCTETIFFTTVMQIQTQTGGNLSEALGNLSEVLRSRKRMKAKVQALSMEAKASAWIIGAMPIIASVMIFIVNSSYILILFTSTIGNMLIGFSVLWMLLGTMTMKKMINFEM